MKLAVVDCNYTNLRYRGLAATWLDWEMQRAGIEQVAPINADILLCTVSSQQGVGRVRWLLRRIGNKVARVIIGGGGAGAPAAFDGLADLICVGEGKRFIRTLITDGYDAAAELPEAWSSGTETVVPSTEFPWELPPLRHPDGTMRVFASRGCRSRCLFCQTGWETTYRINPQPDRLEQQIAQLKRAGHRVAAITNDGADWDIVALAGQDFLSVRFDTLKRIMPITRAITKGVRIGVEGISERLREAIGKPIGNGELLNITFELLTQKRSVGVRWFFVIGLPGETDQDYAEFRQLVQELKRLPKGCVMMNFHAFIPQPAAPLCVLPLEDGYWERFDEFRRWFFHGPGFSRHVQLVAPCMEPARLRRARQSMAATKTELKRGWFHAFNRNWRVKYRADPARMRAIAQRYAHRVGMQIDTVV